MSIVAGSLCVILFLLMLRPVVAGFAMGFVFTLLASIFGYLDVCIWIGCVGFVLGFAGELTNRDTRFVLMNW